MRTTPPRLYSVIEIARAASVHKDTVYDWIKRGELPSVDIGHGRAKTRISERDWQAFIAAKQTKRSA